MSDKKTGAILRDVTKGYIPASGRSSVQGGYQGPTSGGGSSKPPTTGSSIVPPTTSKK